MKTVRFLSFFLLGFLTLAGAQPEPGQPGGEPEFSVEEIMGDIRDEQGVERDEQLDPHAVDPDLLEELGHALEHRYIIVSSLRGTVEQIATQLTGASLRRQYTQVGLAYVSAKVLGIFAVLAGAAESGSRDLLEPPDTTGGGGSGDIGDEGGDEGGGGDSSGGEGGGEDGLNRSGYAGLNRNLSGGNGGSQFGEGGTAGIGSGGAGGVGASGAYAGRTGRAGGTQLTQSGAARGAGSAAARGAYSRRTRAGSGTAGQLPSQGEARVSGGTGSRAGGASYGATGGGGGAGGHLTTADEEQAATDRRYRVAAGRSSGGGGGGSGGLLKDVLGDTKNMSWVVVVIVLAVIAGVIGTIFRIVRFFKRKKAHSAAPQLAPVVVEDSAVRILKERFARDEITREEFEEKRRHLAELSGAPEDQEEPESKAKKNPLADVGGEVMEP